MTTFLAPGIPCSSFSMMLSISRTSLSPMIRQVGTDTSLRRPIAGGSSSCGEGNSAAPIFLNEKYTISVPIILYFGGQSFSPFDHLPLMFFKCYTSLEQILCQFVSIEVKIFFLVDLIVDKFAISNVYSYRAIESSIIYLKANHERAAWPNYARRELTSFW